MQLKEAYLDRVTTEVEDLAARGITVDTSVFKRLPGR